MSGYKLYYFSVRARAEICRLSFAAAKIDFEDIRLDGEEWAKEKACEYNYKTLKLAKFFIGKIAVYKHSFCYSNVPTTKTKELFVSTANRSLVGTLLRQRKLR